MKREGERHLYLVGLLSQYGTYLVLLVTSIVTIPVYLHFMGQNAYGLFISLTSLISYFSVMDAGIGLTAPKYVAEYNAKDDQERLNSMLSTFLLMYCGLFCLAVIGGLALGPVLNSLFKIPEELQRLAPIALAILSMNFGLTLLCGLFLSLYSGMRQVHLQNLFRIAQLLITAIVSIVVVALDGGLIGLSISMATVMAAQLLVLIIAARRSFPNVRINLGQASWSTFREIALPTLHYFIMQIVALVVLSTDNIVIGAFVGVGAVAPYSIAFRFCSYGSSLIWIGSDVLYPFISHWDASGHKEMLKLNHRRLMRFTVFVSILVGLFAAFLGRSIINAWVGPENFAGRTVLYLLGFLLVSSSIVHVSSVVLAGIGQHAAIAYMGMAEAALNLGLSLLLVRHYGIVGVALGTVIAGSATNLWFAPYWACRTLGDTFASFLSEVILPLVGAGTIGVLLYLALDGLLPDAGVWEPVKGIVCGVVYLTLGIILLGTHERTWAKGVLRDLIGNSGRGVQR
ncbi:MAG: lipopolysaccharide biosynthesis protein [Candidatus Geothermincolia bacterium]